MDDEAEFFMFEIAHDSWAMITEPLPESLYDLDALKRLRPIVYAVIHAFTWSLDDSLGLIGRLVEIDRRIAVIERRSSHGYAAVSALLECARGQKVLNPREGGREARHRVKDHPLRTVPQAKNALISGIRGHCFRTR